LRQRGGKHLLNISVTRALQGRDTTTLHLLNISVTRALQDVVTLVVVNPDRQMSNVLGDMVS
jgi:hypothetical protein